MHETSGLVLEEGKVKGFTDFDHLCFGNAMLFCDVKFFLCIVQ